jgi:ATP-dependent protease ClpP protease subunit
MESQASPKARQREAVNLTGPLVDYNGRVASLLGPIDHTEINLLVDQLLRLDTARRKPITLYLSCIGGSLVDAFKVVDIMTGLRSPVITVAMGLVEGAAVIILACAAKRLMLPSSVLSTAGLYLFGTSQATTLAETLQPKIEELGWRSPEIVGLIRRAERRQEFLSAPEALRLGLIDRIQTVRANLPTTERSIHASR